MSWLAIFRPRAVIWPPPTAPKALSLQAGVVVQGRSSKQGPYHDTGPQPPKPSHTLPNQAYKIPLENLAVV